MPILLQMTFADGSTEDLHIPAEIWRRTPDAVKKLIVTDKEIAQIVVDPNWETADVDVQNNHYPRRIIQSRVEAFKSPAGTGLVRRDIMQDLKTKLKTPGSKDDDDGEDDS